MLWRRCVYGALSLVFCVGALSSCGDTHAAALGHPGLGATMRLVRRLHRQPHDVVSGRVIGRSYGDLNIDVGRAQGVDDHEPVLASGQLVGWISGSSRYDSVVIPIDNGVFPITADIDGDAAETGVLNDSSITGAHRLTDLFPSDRIVDGETIDTSPDADGHTPTLSPAGLPIAKIAISNHDRESGNAIEVTPLASPRSVTNVQVLTDGGMPTSAPHVSGSLLDGNEGVLVHRCAATRCRLIFGNGEVFDCQASVAALASDLAEVPPRSCVRESDTTQPAPTKNGLPTCTNRSVEAFATQQSSGRTEELQELFVLLNRSAITCVLSGFPSLKLYSGERLDRFPVQRVTARGHSPANLKLRSGEAAYFLESRLTCQFRTSRLATRLIISLPGPVETNMSRLNAVRVAIKFCSSSRDPGETLNVSPISATPGDTMPLHEP